MWWEPVLNVILLIFGMFLLIKGADWFVEGSSSVAKAMKIPSLIIGLTLVSIGTSMPEFSVSLTSAIQNMNDMSYGNVVGSNIFNVLVVIGISAIFTPMILSKNMQKYDIPILLGIYGLLILFSFVISPNIIGVIEGIILFSIAIIYTLFLILRSKNDVQELEEVGEIKRKWWLNIILIVVGLTGIIFGGDLVVDNASELAIRLKMSEMLVGLTIVAVGTSLPELVTSMVAAKKGENDIAIGNAIGSSMFNVILIIGFSSIVSPITVSNNAFIDVIVMLSSVVLIYVFAFKKKEINRIQGIILILTYIVYLAYIILRNIYHF